MVTETVVRVPAEDLTTIRVKCHACSRVVEGEPTAVADLLDGGNCPCCHKPFFVPTSATSDLRKLATALEGFARAQTYAVEFVVKPTTTR